MGMFLCVTKEHDKFDNTGLKSLVKLPTELLVKVFLYLSIHDRIRMRYVCRRFQDIGETPLLWKKFVWFYGPRHLRMVRNLLKVYGVHVKQLYFPTHVMPQEILETAHYCKKATHLSLPRDTQLTLIDLQQLLYIMTYLQQLEVFTYGNFVLRDQDPSRSGGKFIERLLKVTAACVQQLKLRTYDYQLGAIISSIQEWTNQDRPLPPVINVCSETNICVIPELFKCWLVSSCSKLPSCEIGFYDNEKLPLNLYPLVPVRKFMFGPAATPPFIRLGNHGIMGLEFDMFHLCEYDHYGTIRHALTPARDLCQLHTGDQHFTHVSNLHSVFYVDLSYLNLNSDHLEQLSRVCPNLQRLSLERNVNCIEDLQGLRAIVRMCQNLEIVRLNGISVSRVESHLHLWELLTSLKRLSYLAIDLCMVKPSDSDDANKQKLIAMFKQCRGLQAMEIFCIRDCIECNGSADFLFSHFPSLVHCRLFNFHCSGISYAICNCHRLKYLYERNGRLSEENLCGLINNCHLQQLNISSQNLNVCDEVVQVLSAHGGLESVTLNVNSITFNGICTLIKNSPNLISLHVTFKIPLFDEFDTSRSYDYADRVRNKLSKKYHKLFDFGGKLTILYVGC